MVALERNILIWIRWVLCTTTLLRFFVESNAQILAARPAIPTTLDHFALTSNLSVKIDLTKIPTSDDDVDVTSHVNVKLRLLEDNETSTDKCQTRVPRRRDAVAVFECNCFERAGKYQIVVSDNPNVTTLIATVKVYWPLVNVYMPSSHVASSGNSVSIKFKHKLGCIPLDITSRGYSSKLDILYLNSNDTSAPPQKKKSFKKVYSLSSPDWWTLTSFVVPCQMFVKVGLYKILLSILLSDVVSGRGGAESPLNVISESNTMNTTAFGAYQLKMASVSIFPCPTSGIVVSFDRPSCNTDADRIRLYGVQKNETRPSKRLVYVGEERVTSQRAVVTFSCNYFDLIFLEYCFKFLSALDDGTVLERALQCVPTQQLRYMPINGEWSDWKNWGSCTTTCGTGVQHRFRLCDRPKPKYYGKFCSGSGMETRNCDIQTCPNETTSRVDVHYSVVRSPCQCGCHLTKEETIVIESYSCTNFSIWTMEAPTTYDLVRLLFLSFHLSDDSNEYFTVRDGFNDTDYLLFDSRQTTATDNVDGSNVQSSSRFLRIEYFNTFDKETAGTIWKGIIVKTTFHHSNFGQLTATINNYSTILFIFLPSTSSILLLIGMCIVWSFLFKNAKRKLMTKCHLLKNRTCGSSKEMDPLIDDAKIASPKTNDSSMLDSSGAKTFGDPASKKELDRIVRVTIENGGGEYEKISPIYSKVRKPNLPQIPEEMLASTHTQSTRLSTLTQKSGEVSPPTPKTVRSIGIQLSSPALPLKRQLSFGSKFSVTTPSTLHLRERGESLTNLSIAGTEQDFEYDYSEYAVPGSMLNPTWKGEEFLRSDISIDDIIAQCDLMKSPSPESSTTINEKSSVSTQIQNDVEFSLNVLNNSMKQFHYL